MKHVFIKQLMVFGTNFLSHTYRISKCRQPICHILTTFQSGQPTCHILPHFKVDSLFFTYLPHFKDADLDLQLLFLFVENRPFPQGVGHLHQQGRNSLVVGFERSVSRTGSPQDEGGNRPVNSRLTIRSRHYFWKRMVMREDSIQALFLSVVA